MFALHANPVVILVPMVLFLATFIRSTFGFGEALVAVPLLALFVPVRLAAPLAVLCSITVAVIVVAQDWKQVYVRSALRLIVSSLFGIPVGLWVLKVAPDAAVKAILAFVIIVFAVYSLRPVVEVQLKNDRLAWLFGFAAGLLGGACGMNGPPLAVYGALRRWSPAHFRATLQGYFLLASASVMIGFLKAGLWTQTVSQYYLYSLPGVVVAVLLGRAVNRRLRSGRFYRFVFFGLLLIGIMLLVEAWTGLRHRG